MFSSICRSSSVGIAVAVLDQAEVVEHHGATTRLGR
jgi:hypothetical protein